MLQEHIAIMPDEVLSELGARARALRVKHGWTLREAAERSGLSARFLVQLESGAELRSTGWNQPGLMVSPGLPVLMVISVP